MDWSEILKSTITLFAIVNPIGSIPIFLQLTGNMSSQERNKSFRIGVLSAGVILFVFILAGEHVLTEFFQITLNDLMAAGGLLLLIIAIDHLIFGALVKGVTADKKADAHHIGAVPIACPILAGPGAMMTVLISFSQYGFAVASISVVLVFGFTWLMLRFIDPINSFLGKTVCLVLSKILCLFIAAIGMHLLMTGISHYFK